MLVSIVFIKIMKCKDTMKITIKVVFIVSFLSLLFKSKNGGYNLDM
jgi:hypothetical protein